MTELWRPVDGYDGLYEVSDAGRVRSLPRAGTRGGVLHGDVHPGGYPSVKLSKDGHKTHLTVHTLVISAFRGSRPPGQECRHVNGNPADNRLDNLLWGTSAENSQDMVKHGRSNSRITHCPQGHGYTEENTHVWRGRRYCKACNRAHIRMRVKQRVPL